MKENFVDEFFLVTAVQFSSGVLNHTLRSFHFIIMEAPQSLDHNLSGAAVADGRICCAVIDIIDSTPGIVW